MTPPPPSANGSLGGPKTVALVLGSGAVKCAAAIGIRRVLEREGIPIHLLVGCSGGSIYAAAHALGLTPDETQELTGSFWTRDVMTKRDTRSALSVLFPKTLGFNGAFGLVDDRPLLEAFRPTFGGRTFADAQIPLRIVATDFETGDRVVLSEGSLLDTVRASVAIPFVWKPWRVDGRTLCDGCLSDPMPVDVAMQEGADVILTMGFEAEYPREVSTALKFAFQVTSVYTNNLYRANYSFHNLAHHAEIVPVMPVFEERVGLFSTEKIPYVIKQGERAAEEVLPYVKRLLDAVPATS